MQPPSGVHAELMGSVLSLFPTSPGDDETADAVELRSRLRRRLLIVVALLYSIWYVYTLRAKQSGRRWGHRLAAHFAAACCHATAVLFGLKLQVKYDGDMGGLKEEHKGLVAAVGPHGVFPLAMLGMGAFKFRPDTPYAENGLKDLNARFAGASILFCVPILRELLLLMGVREVSRPTVRRLLATDHTIAIQPGGIWEMVMCSSTQEALYFQVANQPTPSAQASTCARARGGGGGGPVLNPQVSRTVVFGAAYSLLSVVVSHAEISRLRALGDGVRPAAAAMLFLWGESSKHRLRPTARRHADTCPFSPISL